MFLKYKLIFMWSVKIYVKLRIYFRDILTTKRAKKKKETSFKKRTNTAERRKS